MSEVKLHVSCMSGALLGPGSKRMAHNLGPVALLNRKLTPKASGCLIIFVKEAYWRTELTPKA